MAAHPNAFRDLLHKGAGLPPIVRRGPKLVIKPLPVPVKPQPVTPQPRLVTAAMRAVKK